MSGSWLVGPLVCIISLKSREVNLDHFFYIYRNVTSSIYREQPQAKALQLTSDARDFPSPDDQNLSSGGGGSDKLQPGDSYHHLVNSHRLITGSNNLLTAAGCLNTYNNLFVALLVLALIIFVLVLLIIGKPCRFSRC